ncbi:transporter substrate-binding domain-containing protein [Clostridium saccharoperbutylacetonicum]|uniref:transporter substrate-binding domain-containing protein n=1 Tax=Clostridium saccharoperbutylacetonicum TaxID=36745 RepID=UPI0039EB68BE
MLVAVLPLKETPFFYRNTKTNKICGIDYDILNEIAKRLRVSKVEVKKSLFSELLKKLINDNNIDMAVGED